MRVAKVRCRFGFKFAAPEPEFSGTFRNNTAVASLRMDDETKDETVVSRTKVFTLTLTRVAAAHAPRSNGCLVRSVLLAMLSDRLLPPLSLLKCVSVSLDNSEFTRNGDYAPTRSEAQSDAVNLLCNAKV